MTEKHPFGFASLKDLADVPYVPVTWPVRELIRLGHPRPDLICAHPETGKSTLARQLAAAVAIGRPFLGREVIPSEVCWAGTEESSNSLKKLFRELGHDPSAHRAIHVLTESPREKNPLVNLRDFLIANPAVGLCVMEPLDAFLRVRDILDNTKMRDAFDQFDDVLMRDLCQRVAFVGICQLKKRELDSAGTLILGATELRARTDAKIYLRRVSDDDPRRTIMVHVREGRGIDKTYLDYDAGTRISTLGMQVQQEVREKAQAKREDLSADVVKFLHEHPNSTELEILSGVAGMTDRKRRILKEGRSAGWIVPSGEGKPGKPFTYSMRERETVDLKLPELETEIAI